MVKLILENQSLTRRDFLKKSTYGLLGLMALPHLDHHFLSRNQTILSDLTPSHGRVISSTVDVFQSPTTTSKLVSTLWQDHVHPINSVTVGDEEPPYNRIWYEMGDEGFVHSGEIQPVCIRTNPEIEEIPSSGRLAEITVPFTNAVWHPKSLHLITYRLYYGTVFWVKDAVRDNNKKLWYKIADDKWKIHYYVEATHMHLFEPEEITPISPEVPIEQKLLQELGFLIGAIIIAEGRKFVSALLFPDFEVLKKFKMKLNFNGDNISFLQSDILQKFVEKAVDKLNSSLNHSEQIRKFAIITQEISIENSEITPSMKLKRGFLEEKYKKIIDDFYL